MLKVLTYTSLFPNHEQPNHGIFVENRLRHLAETGEVDFTVVAPVPWFPFKGRVFGRYATFARVPGKEIRQGVQVWHPRYPTVPKIGMGISPWLMAKGTLRFVENLVENLGGIDLIDAHYFYPDGVTAALIADRLGVPIVITGRGTDLNYLPKFRKPNQLIKQAIKQCDAMVTVCSALSVPLIELGADPTKVHVRRNGVDLNMFMPKPREDSRRKLGVDGLVLASVGQLIERKGHHLIIEALPSIPGATLIIAGGGAELSSLKSMAKQLGVEDRVRFVGNVPHETLVEVYNASDILVLASSREGWANVLLEAMACGTPVAATRIWGTPEVVTNDVAGRLIPKRSSSAIAETIRDLITHLPDRNATRAYAEQFSWDETTSGLIELFKSISQQPNCNARINSN